jgi:hypothetical protein
VQNLAARPAHPVGIVNGQSDAGRQWHCLRVVALRNPARAAARLQHLLAGAGVADQGSRVDLLVLLAEVRHRMHDLAAAFDAEAVTAAAALEPRDWPRLATALAVEADLAVCADHLQAVQACESYALALTHLEPVNPWRAWHAAALHAVAAYHRRDRHEGLRQLTTLAGQLPAPAGSVRNAVHAGIDAMRDIRPPAPPAGRPPPPLPGGILQPSMIWPAVDYLTYRIRLHPGAQAPDAGRIGEDRHHETKRSAP